MKNENVEKLHQASAAILERTGMRFLHPDAIRVLRENGIRVEGDRAYFTEEQLMHFIHMAPDTCKLYAKDPKYDMQIGGSRVYQAPSAGPTFIMAVDGTKRDAKLKDHADMMRLYEGNPIYHMNGGPMCVPEDIDPSYSTLALHYMSLLHSEKCIWAGSGSYEQVEAVLELTRTFWGISKEEMAERPRVLNCVNTNTPLQLDRNMTETLFTFAKYRQPVVIAAAAMAGTTSPVTMAGNLAVVNAEIIAVIALSQMFAPGTPVLYGSQSTNADLGTCAIAIGSPEGALCYRYCAEMARFYGVPSRGGGALTDAKSLDVQAGYESMLTYYACRDSGVNLVLQSAGILESYLSVSFEKMIVDFEIIDMVERYKRDFVIDEETLPFELIDEVGPGGQYLLEEHTFEFCRKEPFIPNVSVRGLHQDPTRVYLENIQKRLDHMLNAYQRPETDGAVIGKMQKVLSEAGVPAQVIEYMDQY